MSTKDRLLATTRTRIEAAIKIGTQTSQIDPMRRAFIDRTTTTNLTRIRPDLHTSMVIASHTRLEPTTHRKSKTPQMNSTNTRSLRTPIIKTGRITSQVKELQRTRRLRKMRTLDQPFRTQKRKSSMQGTSARLWPCEHAISATRSSRRTTSCISIFDWAARNPVQRNLARKTNPSPYKLHPHRCRRCSLHSAH